MALGLLSDHVPLRMLNEDVESDSAPSKSDARKQPHPADGMVSEPGGVTFKGGLESLYRANLQLRTASRILARLGNFFYATTFSDLQKRTSHLPWERFLAPGQPTSIRVTCHNSKLYHSDAVARSVSFGLAERMGKASPMIKAEESPEGGLAQLINVRLVDDRCTISVDASGDLLHKRGYRLAIAKAPLRETLAAAVLMACDWDKSAPLIDPFCGSGTIPIEAAMMALGIPPGLNRRFEFMGWPDYDEGLWLSIKDQSSNPVAGTMPPIFASDRDAGAIQMAYKNAERAGVEKTIEFKCQAVSAMAPPPVTGWVVTNPPYGKRINEGKDLRNLYAQFGNVLRRNCSGWRMAILCNDRVLLGQMKMELDTSLGFVNGGIPIRVALGEVQ